MGEWEEFRTFRERMNEKIMELGTINTKRFFNLDSRVYSEGALPAKIKEMMGLVASMVLRCDDCVMYHIERCVENGVSLEEFMEIFDVALVVGGSIVIPHLRRAVDRLLKILEEKGGGSDVSEGICTDS
ncbi:MAG: carboxymuconolactone decarboxylase family protein [Thermotogae bacterium]|nr:carboxymuconolactone decarboxylase family protein [Thermotogota bacterium]